MVLFVQLPVSFTEITIESQKTHPDDADDSHLFGTAPFTFESAGETYQASVRIRQPFGTDVEETIEIEPKLGSYRGNWNYNQFHDLVEEYWRSAEKRARQMLGIRGDVKNFAKQRIRIRLTKSYVIDIPD